MTWKLKKSYIHMFPKANQETGECSKEVVEQIMTEDFEDLGKPHPMGLRLFAEYPGKDSPYASDKPKPFVNPNPKGKSGKPRENKEGFNSQKQESKDKKSDS